MNLHSASSKATGNGTWKSGQFPYCSGGSRGGGGAPPPPVQPDNYISLLGHPPTTCLTTCLTWMQSRINFFFFFFFLLVDFPPPRTSLIRHCLDGWAPPPRSPHPGSATVLCLLFDHLKLIPSYNLCTYGSFFHCIPSEKTYRRLAQRHQ